MEKLSNSSHFLDLGGLDSLRVQAQKDEKGALKEVAKQFEGIFIQMLMKSMRDANEAFKSDSPFNSDATAFYEQMRDQQMSMDLSNKGMLGLAELMVQQLSPNDSPITPASVLRGNSDTKVNPSMFINKQDGTQSVDPANMLLRDNPAFLAQHAQSNSAANPSSLASSGVNSAASIQAMNQILSGQKTASASFEASGNSLPNAVVTNTNKAKAQQEKVSQFDNPQHFISVLYPHAEKAAKELGTTAEVLIAQSALETGWGQKVIRSNDGSMSNNLFNIKADKRWQGDKASVNTLEFEQGVAVKQRADFRVYDNIEQSFNDFVSFISQGDRYQDARKVASEPRQFIQALQKAGYATDPQYAKKVISVMQSVTEGLKSVLPGEAK